MKNDHSLNIRPAGALLIAGILTMGGIGAAPAAEPLPELRGADGTPLALPFDVAADTRAWRSAPEDGATILFSRALMPSESVVIELNIEGSAASQVFLRSRGTADVDRFVGMRSVPASAGTTTLRFPMTEADEVASVSIAVRTEDGSPVMVQSMRLRPAGELTIPEAMTLHPGSPLAPMYTHVSLQHEIPVVLQFPSDRISELSGATITVRITAEDGGAGAANTQTLTNLIPKKGEAWVDMVLAAGMPNRLAAPFTVSGELRLPNGESWPLPKSTFGFEMLESGQDYQRIEAEFSSIEDFSVFHRNGEVLAALAIAPFGAVRPWNKATIPTERLDLWVYKIVRFAPLETLYRIPGAQSYGGGGLTSLSFNPDVNGYSVLGFTSVSPRSAETMSIAMAQNSVRVTPNFANPLMGPTLGDEGAALRGNVIVPWRNGYLCFLLETNSQGRSALRLLSTRVFTDWMDLGEMPVDLPEEATWLTVLQEGDDWWLAVGEPAMLWHSTNPLHGWNKVSFDFPEGAGKVQFLRDGQDIAMYAHRISYGRGVVQFSRVMALPRSGEGEPLSGSAPPTIDGSRHETTHR